MSDMIMGLPARAREHWLRTVCAILVLLIVALSHGSNFFRAAEPALFQFDTPSEGLVLDGLLRSADGGTGLGRYARPGSPEPGDMSNPAIYRDFYRANDRSGEFEPYTSQYGAQIGLFRAIGSIVGTDIDHLHFANASLLGLVCALMFLMVWRDLGLCSALGFAAVFAFSPWMVAAGRNLYWIPFTWFLPMLITMVFARRAGETRRASLLMAGLVMVAIFFKSLCGYEYLSTIVIAAFVPLVMTGLRDRRRPAWILRQVFTVGTASVVGFLFAVLFHAQTLSEGPGSGFADIRLLVEKRIYSTDVRKTSEEACKGDAKCAENLRTTLEADRMTVLARYFVFPSFLPWTHLLSDATQIAAEDKAQLKAALAPPSAEALLSLPAEISSASLTFIVRRALECGGFLLLVLTAGFAAARRGAWGGVTYAVALAAPLSWLIIARGHAAAHFHINYVLWYLPFVPIALALLGSRRRRSDEDRP